MVRKNGQYAFVSTSPVGSSAPHPTFPTLCCISIHPSAHHYYSAVLAGVPRNAPHHITHSHARGVPSHLPLTHHSQRCTTRNASHCITYSHARGTYSHARGTLPLTHYLQCCTDMQHATPHNKRSRAKSAASRLPPRTTRNAAPTCNTPHRIT